MKRTGLIILLIAFTAVSRLYAQVDTGSIVFEGTADAKYNGEYVHIYNHLLKEKHDSVQIVNGSFSFKRPFSVATRYMFYSSYELKTKHGYAPFGILVDHPSVVHINADMENLSGSKTTGSPSQGVYEHFAALTAPAQKSMMDKLYAKYGSELMDPKPDTSSQKYKAMVADYDQLNSQYKQFTDKTLETVIRQNPGSFAAIVLLDYNCRDFTLPKLEELYGLLSPELKTGYFDKGIEDNITGRKNSALGSIVTDFTLNDPQSNPLKFSSLKGKYVLIDFWGSWCGPCHTAFPGLRALYAKYHAKGFEILGIATETNLSAWVKDLDKQKLPWLQVVDSQTNSISQKEFAITEYPTTVLVDPDGQIIGRFGDNGKTEEDRDKQLAEIFKN
jgi:thiol-disulfide isomerase/thioredoxin